MVLFKRKPVQYAALPTYITDDSEVWSIEETGEVFTSYEEYLKRIDYYKQKRFVCEITGHSGLSFKEALRSELDASDEVDDEFPDALREPILRKVQFQQISRIDNLVDYTYEEFKRDFYPGEIVTITLGEDRFTGFIREKTKFPELARPDGTLERKAYARYFCYLDERQGEEALVDEDQIARERKTFTKQRLRSFLKNSVTREAWTGAPWLVKPRLAEEYRISTTIPDWLTHDHQSKQRKINPSSGKKGEYEGLTLNLYGARHSLPLLKPKGSKGKNAQDDMQRWRQEQYAEYQRSTVSNPDFRIAPQGQPTQFNQFQAGPPHGFRMVQGFQPIAAKGQPKPAPPPPPPKYPIEDLEIPPVRDGTHRPPLKFLSESTPSLNRVSEGAGSGIAMESVGLLLETWDTLNVYCEVFQLDSFTFDDYVEALRITSEDVHCELLVEIHCAVLKKLVNDSNDKNGQVQISLPYQVESEEEESVQESSAQPSPTPEPEIKPPARSTRGSLAKSEAAELKQAANGNEASPANVKVHRAVEMDHSMRGYDWKMRLRKRDFSSGHWVVIVVGLLNQLSSSPRLTESCNEILRHLAPLDKDATPEIASAQYQTLDINLRTRILQILCMKSVETKAIRQYMEDCSAQMTEHRKEKNEVQRSRKAAVEELRVLHEERKTLQPESISASPPAELEELSELKMEPDEEEPADEDEVMDSDEEEPHQGRTLRRANDRAAARKKKQREEKERKETAQAEKAKKPSKQEKQYDKVLKKIEEVKEKIKEFEEEVHTLENDLREADCPRTRVLGKDRFWNRYYWMERNAMPYAGLPDSSTADAGYANGCLWVQGPDDLEREGFIELSPAENEQYRRAFQMTVPERKMIEEGDTHTFTARQWGYYDDPDRFDMLIGWLDVRGVRELKLRKELQAQREKICLHMTKRHEYLSMDEKKSEASEPTTRVSTRTKTYVDSTGHRCLAWKNNTAITEIGHLHSEPKPPAYKKQKGVAQKKALIVEEEEPRQTRATNRQGKVPTRQGTRYNF